MSARTILHVEDNEFNRKIVRDLLTRTSYRLVEAVDGEEGVQMALRERPDLVLIDIQLPKMSGLEVTRRLRTEPATAHVPIIVITSFALSGDDQPAQLQVYGDAVKTANTAVGWQIVGGTDVSLDLLCGNEYTQGGGVIVTNTAFSPVKAIFSGVCTGCHSDGAASSQAFAFLGLNSDAHAHIVGVDSWELQAMKRIAAGIPTGSYLLLKLKNTHTGLGSYQSPGPGGQMPQGGPFLGASDLNTISGWITGGALP